MKDRLAYRARRIISPRVVSIIGAGGQRDPVHLILVGHRVAHIAIDCLAKVRVAPFDARVAGMGAFPGRTIRVVWLGLEGNFEELYQKVEEALAPLGFEREERGFSPHVTLGRVGRPGPQTSRLVAERIASLSSTDLGRFSVDRFYLKKSTLTRGGPIYDNLSEFPL